MMQHEQSEDGPLGSSTHFAPSEYERELFVAVRAKFSEHNREIPVSIYNLARPKPT